MTKGRRLSQKQFERLKTKLETAGRIIMVMTSDDGYDGILVKDKKGNSRMYTNNRSIINE